jgi:Tol biopolymer transport system component
MRIALSVILVLLLALAACGDDDDSTNGSTYTGDPTGRIAFTTERDGNEEVYVMNADGGNQVNLSQDPANDEEAAWSPDGGRIAFVSNRDGQPDLYLMDADGGNVTRVTDDPAVEARITWSPDGERLALYSARSEVQGLLWVMNIDGSDPVPLLESITPSTPEITCAGGIPGSWFLDGETILYRGTQADISAQQICSVKDDGSEITAVLSTPNTEYDQPKLAPDGTKIVFTSTELGNLEIFVANADGSGKTRLTVDPGADVDPTWSPDSQWIAFASERGGSLDVYIMRPDGTDVRRLTDQPGSDLRPSWGP